MPLYETILGGKRKMKSTDRVAALKGGNDQHIKDHNNFKQLSYTCQASNDFL
jgi:hypothetical protein